MKQFRNANIVASSAERAYGGLTRHGWKFIVALTNSSVPGRQVLEFARRGKTLFVETPR